MQFVKFSTPAGGDSEEDGENQNPEEVDEYVCQARDVRKRKARKIKRLTGGEKRTIRGVLEEAERWNISERGTAAVMNAVGAALGTITNKDQSQVFSKNDVNRLKGQLRKQAVQERKSQSPLAIGLDERKDKTKVLAGEGERGHSAREPP